MPSGNIDNLVKNEDRTPEERRENASKAGKASVEARRKKKQLREALEILLERNYGKKGGEQMTGTEAMAYAAVMGAMRGDWKAWELVRDTTGQKPVERVVTAEVPADVIDEIEELVFGRGEDGGEDGDN